MFSKENYVHHGIDSDDVLSQCTGISFHFKMEAEGHQWIYIVKKDETVMLKTELGTINLEAYHLFSFDKGLSPKIVIKVYKFKDLEEESKFRMQNPGHEEVTFNYCCTRWFSAYKKHEREGLFSHASEPIFHKFE